MGMLRLLGEAESGLHTHPEADITDGSLLARLAADETISGQWDFLASLRLASQLTVGAITAAAASASLDLVAADKALILNRLTTAQRDALTAVDGMLLYNSTTAAFEGRKAGSWVSLTGGGDHNILSATHLDTVAAAVARGDLMVGQGVTATWQRLPLGSPAQVLRSNGADALWATLTHADLGGVTPDQHHAQAHDQGSAAIHTGLTLSADTISEKTAAAGVTIDGAKIKDGVAPYRLLATFTSEKGVDLAVTTGTHRFPVIGQDGATVTIKAVRAMVGTAPTGAGIIIDVNKNGTTIFTTQGNRPTIAAGANDSGKVTNMDVTNIAEGDYLGVDIDQVGSTTPGRDLTVVIEYEVTL